MSDGQGRYDVAREYRPKSMAARWAGRLAARAGMVTVRGGIYCPVRVSLPPPDDPWWRTPVALHGFSVDTAAQLEFVRGSLTSFLSEFDAELGVGGPDGFEPWNAQFLPGDAEFLYAMVRHLRPRRVLEIGSGFSTQITAAACERNAREGHPVSFVAVDPRPRADLEQLPGVEFQKKDCRSLPLEGFAELGDGDILFIDSSHIVKLGSEVNMLLLELLPSLAPGVVVQIHDIYLPYEYDRFLYEFGGHFNEQYLLQALLTENQNWAILLSACALTHEHRGKLAETVPRLAEAPPDLPGFEFFPSSWWMRRTPARPA